MHEAGLLAAAVAEALAAGSPDLTPSAGAGGPGSAGARRPAAIAIRVMDPIHVAPESAYLHAELALRARGWADVEITVTADPVACAICDVVNEVRAEHPFCSDCGFPLPDRGGHLVAAQVTRWVDDTTATGSGPAAPVAPSA